MDIINWPSSKPIPYAANARQITPDAVAKVAVSIKEFGFRQPIVVDKNGVIIAGHTRLMAAQQLGLDTVPVHVADKLTAAQVKQYRLMDNRSHQETRWDFDVLKVELGEMNIEGIDLAFTGFDPDELLGFLNEPTDGLTDPDDVPTLADEAISVLGDVWELGNHRIICGSSTDPGCWSNLNPPRPSMVFTSPPYGIGQTAKLRDKYVKGSKSRKSLYQDHDDSPDEWPDLMSDWTGMALAASDCIVCNVQMLASNKRSMVRWLADIADHIVDIAIWDKGNGPPQMQKNILTNVFEWLVILSSESNASRSVPLSDFHGNLSNVVRIKKSVNEYADKHGATMPIDLAKWAIELCPLARNVIEPFSGSGTTIIAAEMTGRHCYAIELNPLYVDMAVKRWQNFTGKKAIHADTKEPFPAQE